MVYLYLIGNRYCDALFNGDLIMAASLISRLSSSQPHLLLGATRIRLVAWTRTSHMGSGLSKR